MSVGRDGKSVLADLGHRVRFGMGTKKHGIDFENEGFPFLIFVQCFLCLSIFFVQATKLLIA